MSIKQWLPEFPISSEDDVDLMNYFLNTPQIRELIETPKWMVLGRKGTGKTAIYKYFQSPEYLNNGKRITIGLNFKDYPWPIHKLYKDTMEGEINAYFRSWTYLITIQSLTKLIAHFEKNGIELQKDLLNAKKQIEKIYGNPFPSVIEVIKGKLFRLNKLSLPSIEAGEINLSAGDIEFDEVSKNETLVSLLRTNAFALNDYFQNILYKYINDYEINIVIDQLDENWLEGEIYEYSKILINLIMACKNINNESIENRRKMKCILFLRTDIFDTLRFNDKNKVYQSSAIIIRWDEESLNNMFFERIRKNLPQTTTINLESRSNSIFDITYVKHGATPFKHILRMSFYRPRDIIVFFNKVRQVHVASKSGLYTSKNLYDAENDYSLSLYQELIDEWANQKPEIVKYLNILQNIELQKFSYKEFSDAYSVVYNNAQPADVENCLYFLFQNSIIGQKINANWEYVCTNPHMQINYNKDYYVNNGLKKRLVLAETRRKKKIQIPLSLLENMINEKANEKKNEGQ